MNSLNSVLLEGNLEDKPTIEKLPNGETVCKFTVESYRYFKVGNDIEKDVSYFNVETWGGLGDRCGGELDKGRGVRVVGRLKQVRIIGASSIVIVAEHVEFKPIIEVPPEVEYAEQFKNSGLTPS